MTAESATPRTDAAAVGFARLLVDKDKFTVTELVDANFARSLERELQQVTAERAALRKLLAKLKPAVELVLRDAVSLKLEGMAGVYQTLLTEIDAAKDKP